MFDIVNDGGEVFTSPQQRKLWQLLRAGKARRISVLAIVISGELAHMPRKYQQQRVTAIVSRMNDKLPETWRIRPGEARGTYQLQQVKPTP